MNMFGSQKCFKIEEATPKTILESKMDFKNFWTETLIFTLRTFESCGETMFSGVF